MEEINVVATTENNKENPSSINSNQCRNLQQDTEKKEELKKNGGKGQRTSKQELHTIVDVSRQTMESAKTANKNKEELKK